MVNEVTQSGAPLQLLCPAEVQLATIICCLLGITLFFLQYIHFSYNNLNLLSHSSQLSQNKIQLKDPHVQKTLLGDIKTWG